MQGDAECLPDATPDKCICGPKFVPGKGCVGPQTKFMCKCTDTTNTFNTNGKCVNTFKCKAESTSGKDGFGLDQVAKMLGDLMGKLMKGGKESGQQGNATPQTPPQPPTCDISAGLVSTTASSSTFRLSWKSYFYGASGAQYDASGTATISPLVGSVEQSGSREVTISQTTSYTMSVSGAGGSGSCNTMAIHTGGGCTGTSCDPEPEPEDETGKLQASPTSGSVPLKVGFTTNGNRADLTIDFGDNESSSDWENSYEDESELYIEHTYTSVGTFTARVTGGTAPASASRASITVSATTTTPGPGPGPTPEPEPVDVASLQASPEVGSAPLDVNFVVGVGRSGCRAKTQTLYFGDGASYTVPPLPGTICEARTREVSHTYQTAGTYTARVTGEAPAGSEPIARVVVRASSAGGSGGDNNSGGSSTGGGSNINTNINTGTSGSGGSNSSSLETLTYEFSGDDQNAKSSQARPVPVFSNPAFLLPGLRGDIQLIQTGGTVFAGTRDLSKNTEVSGFYGSYTFSNQPEGVAARLCTNRPWAGGFLSYVIPETFFDSLCTSRGYQVGISSAPPAPTTVTVTQTPVQVIKKTSTPTKPAVAKPAATTTPASTSRARVWAVPAAVPLGSRTSVFWSAQGVTECKITSPDGNFSQSSLSGGASTAPITAPTTFTISCLTADGTPVTNYTTVTVSI